MRFGHGSQRRCSFWVAVVWCVCTAFLLPNTVPLFAQENPGQVGYFAETLPAGRALAKIEADGHSRGDARQLLEGQLSSVQDGVPPTNSNDNVSSARLQGDQLYVQGSLEYIRLVQQQIKSIENFGLQQLLYTIRVVEVPTEEVAGIIEPWRMAVSINEFQSETIAASPPKDAVVPASFTAATTHFEIRISDPLSEQQINELVGLGEVVATPKLIGYIVKKLVCESAVRCNLWQRMNL